MVAKKTKLTKKINKTTSKKRVRKTANKRKSNKSKTLRRKNMIGGTMVQPDKLYDAMNFNNSSKFDINPSPLTNLA